MNRKSIKAVFILLSFMIALGSCSVIEKGTRVLDKAEDVKDSEVTKAVRSTFSDITEEEEYYIGRAVSALIFSKYPAYGNQAIIQYINYVGSSVVYYSDRPETYAGYHFMILDTDEVNALAAPGGFIFITKGLLKRCADEEMLACILAHEVGHVAAKHGLKSIKKSRLIEAFRILGTEAAKKYGSEEVAQLTEIFEGVLGDIVEKLGERGYDRKFEYEADRLGVKIAANTGYSPEGLTNFLRTMIDDASDAKGKGWFKTHPSAEDRMGRVSEEIASLKDAPEKETERTERFVASLKSLK